MSIIIISIFSSAFSSEIWIDAIALQNLLLWICDILFIDKIVSIGINIKKMRDFFLSGHIDIL